MIAPVDRPLRLWIVHQNATPPEQGGLPRAHHLARALVRRGYQVTIVAGSFVQGTGHNRLPPGERRRAEVHDEVEMIWLRTPGHRAGLPSWLGNMLAFGWRVGGEQPAAATAPDLVLGSTPPSLAALAAERLAARLGVPFVLEVRDLWPGTLIERGSLARWSPLRPILSLIERHLHRRAAQIVITLPPTAAHLQTWGPDSGRTSWLPAVAEPEPGGDPRQAGRRYDRLADSLDRSLRLTLAGAGPSAMAAADDPVRVTASDQREPGRLGTHRKGD